MSKEIINSDKAPKAIGPYSQAIKAGGFVFVSGQIPIDPATGEVVHWTVADETKIILENIQHVLEAAGLTMKDIVKTTIYLTDMEDFGKMNEAYAAFFESEPPARATIQVVELPKRARLEIEAIAYAG